jgi:hypothetical protein
MYTVKDLKYDNRWVEVKGETIKFAGQMASVPDKVVKFFRKNPDFVILEQTSVDDLPQELPQAPKEVVPIVTQLDKKTKK